MRIKERDLEALCLIEGYVESRGYAVTVRELGELMGVTSPSTTHQRLHRLRAEGFVDFVDGEPRTLHLTDRGKRALTGEHMFGTMGAE